MASPSLHVDKGADIRGGVDAYAAHGSATAWSVGRPFRHITSLLRADREEPRTVALPRRGSVSAAPPPMLPMKRILTSALFLVFAACGGNQPNAATSADLTGRRCSFGQKSYPTLERICDHGREMECREDVTPEKLAGWVATGAACKSGEPQAVAVPPK